MDIRKRQCELGLVNVKGGMDVVPRDAIDTDETTNAVSATHTLETGSSGTRVTSTF